MSNPNPDYDDAEIQEYIDDRIRDELKRERERILTMIAYHKDYETGIEAVVNDLQALVHRSKKV